MLGTFEAVKDYLITGMGPVLKSMETEDCQLPVPEKRNIIFGTCDLGKNEAKVLVCVVPDSEHEYTGDLSAGVVEGKMVVCFAFRGLPYEMLMERMDKYAEAFRMSVRADGSLGGGVLDADIGETQYFPDAGPTHGTVTVAEIELTVRTKENLAAGIDPFA